MSIVSLGSGNAVASRTMSNSDRGIEPLRTRSVHRAAAIEIHEPVGVFERIEEWLREHGFFAAGGEHLEADLYLGFGLSSTIRRGRSPGPPEPCPLPLAACTVRQNEYVVSYDNNGDETFEIGPWSQTWRGADYASAVERVREAISLGDVYQVNLVQHLSASFTGDPGALAARLAPLKPLNREPYRGDGWAVVSGSPELFLSRRGRRVWTCPIKGTRPAGGAAALAASPKDRAEHVMIVDLERNDLGRLAEVGSVRVDELFAIRRWSGLWQAESTLSATLAAGVGLADLLRAVWPGGSVTGAPKLAAIDIAARLEPVGRGPSMGAFGWIGHDPGGRLKIDLGLTIRTVAITAGRAHVWAGGGIVWDSDPAAEVEEAAAKAAPIKAALAG